MSVGRYNKRQKWIARRIHSLKSYDRKLQVADNPNINAHELIGMKINILGVRLKLTTATHFKG